MSGLSPLTVVILTKNEEARIRRCLSSIKLLCPVLIYDSYSTDATLAEARKTWVDAQRPPELLALVQGSWKGFTQTRNETLKWVQTPWVLWLDADEWLSEALVLELQDLGQLSCEDKIFRIPRQSFFLGRAIRYGGWYPDLKSRLARSSEVEWVSGPGGADVHEDLIEKREPRSRAKSRPRFKGEIYHEGFKDQREQFETNQRYSELLALGLAARYKKEGRSPPSHWWIALKMGIKFFENYFFKGGFLDGYPGFVIARGSAQSLGMRMRKLRELLK